MTCSVLGADQVHTSSLPHSHIAKKMCRPVSFRAFCILGYQVRACAQGCHRGRTEAKDLKLSLELTGSLELHQSSFA